ncbi:unnamed protein product [Pleuronectes platessa]|uniref:Uncharacterized protein n=1 Tax=Pleuronectes platessa TaxID=8262 RepID=A0A9N7TL39_PLEPL|nr:unnamed protein product [Pleuronectes platessa]
MTQNRILISRRHLPETSNGRLGAKHLLLNTLVLLLLRLLQLAGSSLRRVGDSLAALSPTCLPSSSRVREVLTHFFSNLSSSDAHMTNYGRPSGIERFLQGPRAVSSVEAQDGHSFLGWHHSATPARKAPDNKTAVPTKATSNTTSQHSEQQSANKSWTRPFIALPVDLKAAWPCLGESGLLGKQTGGVGWTPWGLRDHQQRLRKERR